MFLCTIKTSYLKTYKTMKEEKRRGGKVRKLEQITSFNQVYSKNLPCLTVFIVNLNPRFNGNTDSYEDDDTLSKQGWQTTQYVAPTVWLQHCCLTLITGPSCPENVIKLVALCLTLFPKAWCNSKGCQAAVQSTKSREICSWCFMLSCCYSVTLLEKSEIR